MSHTYPRYTVRVKDHLDLLGEGLASGEAQGLNHIVHMIEYAPNRYVNSLTLRYWKRYTPNLSKWASSILATAEFTNDDEAVHAPNSNDRPTP